MDTGRYRAMLVQDPGDPQAIKGFINFARVVSASALASGTTQGATNSLRFLVNGLNEYTGINADFMGSITYDDERLLEIPIILPSGSPNESELEQMTRYLTSGGFIFGGIGFVHEGLEKYAGLVEGRDFGLKGCRTITRFLVRTLISREARRPRRAASVPTRIRTLGNTRQVTSSRDAWSV